MFIFLFETALLSLSLIIPLLITVAFFTLAERKTMAAIQRRSGPNVVGFGGSLQPFADGLKLIVKETLIPNKAQRFMFIVAPGFIFFLSLLPWAAIPFSQFLLYQNVNLGLIFVFTVSSLGIYGILLAGMACNSRYGFLGAIRAVVQVISYELPLSLILVTLGLLAESYNLLDIIGAQKSVWFLIPLFPLALIFLFIILVETNRSPSDLPESESELVAGYSIDYSAIGFAMFFLGEYSNMLIMSAIFVITFCGGWLLSPIPHLNQILANSLYVVDTNFFSFNHTHTVLTSFEGSLLTSLTTLNGLGLWFILKICIVSFYFVWVRATVPRLRYDFLLLLCWKKLLPFVLSFYLAASSLVLIFG